MKFLVLDASQIFFFPSAYLMDCATPKILMNDKNFQILELNYSLMKNLIQSKLNFI